MSFCGLCPRMWLVWPMNGEVHRWYWLGHHRVMCFSLFRCSPPEKATWAVSTISHGVCRRLFWENKRMIWITGGILFAAIKSSSSRKFCTIGCALAEFVLWNPDVAENFDESWGVRHSQIWWWTMDQCKLDSMLSFLSRSSFLYLCTSSLAASRVALPLLLALNYGLPDCSEDEEKTSLLQKQVWL